MAVNFKVEFEIESKTSPSPALHTYRRLFFQGVSESLRKLCVAARNLKQSCCMEAPSLTQLSTTSYIGESPDLLQRKSFKQFHVRVGSCSLLMINSKHSDLKIKDVYKKQSS